MATVYKNAGLIAARLVGDSQAMTDASSVVLSAVRIRAAQHRASGDYMASLGMTEVKGKRGVTDRFIYSDDPAALSIEFGHFAEDGSWVPGQFIMLGAIEDVT